MTVEVTLRGIGLDLDDDHQMRTLSEEFEEVFVSAVGPIATLTVFVDADRVEVETLATVRAICKKLPSIRITSVHRDLVNTSDIAHRVGVSRQAVDKWTKLRGFPTSYDYLLASSMEVWAWDTIVLWLKEVKAIDMEENFPSPSQIASINHFLMQEPASKKTVFTSVQSRTVPRTARVSRTVHKPNYKAADRGSGSAQSASYEELWTLSEPKMAMLRE